MKKNLPTKEFCLWMAEHSHKWGHQKIMWEWLIAWGFYEMYSKEWFKK